MKKSKSKHLKRAIVNTIGLLIFLGIIFSLGWIEGQNNGLTNGLTKGTEQGKQSVRLPFISMDYADTNNTNCSVKMPFWFGEQTAPIVKSRLDNETFAWFKWYVSFNPNEWKCNPDRIYDKSQIKWCDCEFVGNQVPK